MPYILILTLMASSGNAVTQVPGFQNADACVSAGKAWAERLPQDGVRGTYLCVALK
jgi:hypothetical protein